MSQSQSIACVLLIATLACGSVLAADTIDENTKLTELRAIVAKRIQLVSSKSAGESECAKAQSPLEDELATLPKAKHLALPEAYALMTRFILATENCDASDYPSSTLAYLRAADPKLFEAALKTLKPAEAKKARSWLSPLPDRK